MSYLYFTGVFRIFFRLGTPPFLTKTGRRTGWSFVFLFTWKFYNSSVFLEHFHISYEVSSIRFCSQWWQMLPHLHFLISTMRITSFFFLYGDVTSYSYNSYISVFSPMRKTRNKNSLPSPSKLFTITVQKQRLLEKFCGTLSFIEIEQVLFFLNNPFYSTCKI